MGSHQLGNQENLLNTTEAARQTERERIKEINAISKTGVARGITGIDDVTKTAIDKAISAEDFRREIFAKIETSATLAASTGAIGMTGRELDNYSIFRAIDARLRGDWSKAGLEREASDAVASQMGKAPIGFYVPFDVLVDKRDLTSSGSAGSLIGTDHLAGSFIEVLRNHSVASEMGATFLPGLVGDVSIPKMDSGAEFGWIDSENYFGSDESTPSFSPVTLSPKTVRGRVDITRKMIKQGLPSVEAIIRADLARGVAEEIDRAALYGSGANDEPKGIIGSSGVATVAVGADGGSLNWDVLVDLETACAIKNADRGNLGYVTNAKIRGTMKKTVIDSGGAVLGFLMDSEGRVNGHKCLISNAVPSDLTKGDGTNLSAVVFGNWSELLVGMWGGLDIEPDAVTHGDAGGLILRVFQDVDVSLRRTDSFSTVVDAAA